MTHLLNTRVASVGHAGQFGWTRGVTYGTIEKIDDGSCRLTIGADTPQSLAFLLAFLEVDFTVESSVELADALRQVTERFQRAVKGVDNSA